LTSPTCSHPLGTHTLPVGEDSWYDADADLLIAACLDGCQPCQDQVSKRISRDPGNQSFGKLFTTFVMGAATDGAQIGIRPRRGTDLFPGAARERFQHPTWTVLGAVKFAPPPTAPAGLVAMSMPDASEAVPLLRTMSRQDRLVLLNDVLDIVVGRMEVQRLMREATS
jgi:hypothetical protein